MSHHVNDIIIETPTEQLLTGAEEMQRVSPVKKKAYSVQLQAIRQELRDLGCDAPRIYICRKCGRAIFETDEDHDSQCAPEGNGGT